ANQDHVSRPVHASQQAGQWQQLHDEERRRQQGFEVRRQSRVGRSRVRRFKEEDSLEFGGGKEHHKHGGAVKL
ncbi:hypothetical protein A2U01_0101975, partial [Trifolium medium]|nr:hypothetical protein [Trifolium medium]